MAKAHQLYSPARHFALSPVCASCHKLFRSVRQCQQHLKCSPSCLGRAVHLFPPLSYDQILALESPEKLAAKKLKLGLWKDFSASAPPVRVPFVQGPFLPTADERIEGLDESKILVSDLMRIFRPTSADVSWIVDHISQASREGPRVHAKRFWQRRPA